jgi:hypothetical protein
MPSTARDSLLERLGLSQAPSPQPPARLRFALYPAGLPLGQLVLIQGPGRTQAVARLLAEHPDRLGAWVEERLSAYPPGLAQQGVDLRRLLFVESGAQGAWVLAQLLRSQAFGVLVAASALKGAEVEAGLRRLQLAAERSQALVLLLAPPEGPAWAVRLRLQCVGRGDGLRLIETRGEQAQAR